MSANCKKPRATKQSRFLAKPRRVLAYDIGMRNLSYAVVSYDPGANEHRIEHWDNVDVIVQGGSQARVSTKVPIAKVTEFLFQVLNDTIDVLTKEPLDAVVVEMQQIGRAVQKTLGHLIVQFFHLWYLWKRGGSMPTPDICLQTGAQKLHVVMDVKDLPNLRLKHVTAAMRRSRSIATPSRPLSMNEMRLRGISAPKTDRERYNENKEYAVWQTRLFLEHITGHKKKQFTESQKQDDLADSLLHSLFYLHTGASTTRNKDKTVVVSKARVRVDVDLTENDGEDAVIELFKDDGDEEYGATKDDDIDNSIMLTTAPPPSFNGKDAKEPLCKKRKTTITTTAPTLFA